jgi:hypothetical protein
VRIEVTRTGGFAANARHATLDTKGRPDAGRLQTLAEAALAPADPLRPVPDGFSYTITVDATRTAHCADPHLTAAQRELIQTVLGEGA